MPQLEAIAKQHKDCKPLHSRALAASANSNHQCTEHRQLNSRDWGIYQASSAYRFSCANREKYSPYSSQLLPQTRQNYPQSSRSNSARFFSLKTAKPFSERYPQPVSEQAFESK